MQKLVRLNPGKYYHIYNRGNNKENIFLEDRNYLFFLDLYKHYIEEVADTLAYCLMKNHFHLLVCIKSIDGQNEYYEKLRSERDEKPFKSLKNPTQQFSNFFNSYAKSFNKVYNRTGSLFQKPFRRNEITSNQYFSNLIFYIHYNPQKHGFVSNYKDYPYSSYNIITSELETILEREKVIQFFGDKESYINFDRSKMDEKIIEKVIEDDFD
jgi:REP element-mobilizing transposase RayT